MIDEQGISTGKDVRQLMQQIENELVLNYKRFFRQGKDKPIDDIDLDKWKESRIKKFTKFKKSNHRIIKDKIPLLEKAIYIDLQASYDFGIDYVDKQLKGAQKRGYKAKKVYKAKSFKDNARTKRLVYEMKQDINRALNNVLKDLEDHYTNTINKVVNGTVAGKTIYGKVDRASKGLMAGGITGTVTKNGRHINVVNHMELIAVEISQEALFHGEGEKAQEENIDTVYISVHTTSCKLCTPWQGKILIDDVYQDGRPNKNYPLLSQAIKEGLFH